MIQQIDNPEVITAREAMRKYSTHYIGFVIIEQNMRSPDDEKGYVLFLADDYYEAMEECVDIDLNIGVLRGYGVDEPVEVGGLEVVWR